MQTLLDFCRQYVSLNDSALQMIVDSFSTEFFPRWSIVPRKGNDGHYLYVVLKGIVRELYTANDEQVTDLIWQEYDVFGYKERFGNTDFEDVNYQAIEDTVLARISFRKWHAMMNESPEIGLLGHRLLGQHVNRMVMLRRALRTMSRMDLYRFLTEQYGEFVQRVPQELLASFLGVRPETLSRFRRSFLAARLVEQATLGLP
jgi:CRP-like cAMP-binding protein